MAPSGLSCAVVRARRAHSRPQYLTRWRPEEDSVLLDHVMEHGTTEWGLLQRSGRLPGRDNKACCNRFILLRRKFMRQKRCHGFSEASAFGAQDPADSHGSAGSPTGSEPTAPPAPREPLPTLWPNGSLPLQFPRSLSVPTMHPTLTLPPFPENGGAVSMGCVVGDMASPQPGMLEWTPFPMQPGINNTYHVGTSKPVMDGESSSVSAPGLLPRDLLSPAVSRLWSAQCQDASEAANRSGHVSSQQTQQQQHHQQHQQQQQQHQHRLLVQQGLIPSSTHNNPHMFNSMVTGRGGGSFQHGSGGGGSSCSGSGSISMREGLPPPRGSETNHSDNLQAKADPQASLVNLEALLLHLATARIPPTTDRPPYPPLLQMPLTERFLGQTGTGTSAAAGMADEFRIQRAVLESRQALKLEASESLTVHGASRNHGGFETPIRPDQVLEMMTGGNQ